MKTVIKKYFLYLVVIVLIIIFGLFKIIPLAGNSFSKGKEVKTKQETIQDLKKSIDIAQKNKATQERSSTNDEKQIYEPQFKSSDAMVNFNEMLETTLELAKESGLKIKTIEFKDIPESDIIKQNHASNYDSTLLATQLIGTYTELQNFLREIYRHQYLIGIYDLKVVPYELDKKILIIDLSLSLYSKK